MRLLNYMKAGKRALGARNGDVIIDLTSAGLPDSVDALLAMGSDGLRKAQTAATKGGETTPFAQATLLPPVLNPSKAIAVGLNYIDHAAESPYKDAPKYPVLFHRFPSSWVAHNQPLIKPRVSDQFDYEAELAVIIGKAGRYIPKDRALDHVVGYSLFNDGSIRDYQFKSHQWMIGKNFDATASFGPELVTADELPAGAVGLQIKAKDARLGDISQFLGRNRADRVAALGFRHHQGLGLQHRQRLAHRAEADVKFAGQGGPRGRNVCRSHRGDGAGSRNHPQSAPPMILASGLSFLGLGVRPPEPEWGLMLNTLRTAIYVNPLVAALPGMMIFITSISFNLFSDGLRTAMDVRT